MNSAFSRLLTAFRATHRVSAQNNVDQATIHVKAAHTERALAEAVNGLAELIDIALSNNLGSDRGRLFGSLHITLELEVILQSLRQLNLDLRKAQSEIGDTVDDLRVVHVFAEFFEHLGRIDCLCDGGKGGSGVSNVGHTKYSVIIDVLQRAEDARHHFPELRSDTPGSETWYLNLAEALVFSEAGFIPQSP